MIKISRTRIFSIIIILLIITSISGTALFLYERHKYMSLEQEHNNLETNYNFLEFRYNLSSNSYNSLLEQYQKIQDEYTDLLKNLNKYDDLPIDHLMELIFSKIRNEAQPHYSPWMGIRKYDSLSVEYAAYVCAHDLGRYHWPNLESNYYENTGIHLYEEAHSKIKTAADIINISKNYTAVENIKRILDFITSYITYQDDLNDEFLFPTETLTFRSGDCDDFSILAATLFEEVGIESAIGFFQNKSEDVLHAMVLVNLNDLGSYEYWSYANLTKYGLSEGKWIIIEPQLGISRQHDENLLEKYKITAASEVPN